MANTKKNSVVDEEASIVEEVTEESCDCKQSEYMEVADKSKYWEHVDGNTFILNLPIGCLVRNNDCMEFVANITFRNGIFERIN